MQKMLHAVNETLFQNQSANFRNKNSITAIQTKVIKHAGTFSSSQKNRGNGRVMPGVVSKRFSKSKGIEIKI